MLKSILIASDLSHRSLPALARGLQLAAHHGARVGVLHVVDEDQPRSMVDEELQSARAYLDDQLERLGPAYECEVLTLEGDAFQVIDDVAETRAADLICMGAHRRRRVKDLFIGTTIERVVRTAGRPVLMAGAAKTVDWKQVFIAVDMSDHSAHAARTAYELGLLRGVEVTFVHAYAPILREMLTYAGVEPDRVREEAQGELDKARQELARFIQRLDLHGVSYGARIIEGTGASAIAGLVERSSPDLLVLGARGLTGGKRILFGSVARELLRTLEIDVLAVPQV